MVVHVVQWPIHLSPEQNFGSFSSCEKVRGRSWLRVKYTYNIVTLARAVYGNSSTEGWSLHHKKSCRFAQDGRKKRIKYVVVSVAEGSVAGGKKEKSGPLNTETNSANKPPSRFVRSPQTSPSMEESLEDNGLHAPKSHV